MATALFNVWKIVHAKFVKPVDTALDSFAMLMLQWMLGVYNFWDVLRISSNVCISAVQSLAHAIRHPSVLWNSTTHTEAENASDTAGNDDEAGDGEPQLPDADAEGSSGCDDLADGADGADGDKEDCDGPLRRRQIVDDSIDKEVQLVGN